MPGVFKTIPPEDQSITPFKVYKSWEYTGTSANRYSELTSESIHVLTAIKPNPANFSNGKIPLDFDEECNLDPAAKFLNITNKDIPTGLVWHGLKHHPFFNDYNGQINFGVHATPDINNEKEIDGWDGLFFKRNNESLTKTYNHIDHTLNPSSSCELGTIASVITIPQSKFGEEIKPGTVEIYIVAEDKAQLTHTITDDGHGNLISNRAIPAPKVNERILNITFDKCQYQNISNTVTADPRYPTELEFYNVNTSDGLPQVANFKQGMSADFSQSYIRVSAKPSYFNPKSLDNYAVSFWANPESFTPGHGVNSYLISKRNFSRNYNLVSPAGRFVQGPVWRGATNITPYSIFYTPGGELLAQAGDGSNLVTLSGGTFSPNSNAIHITFQKSASSYELYIDGTMADNTTANLENITNDADIFIGSAGIYNGNPYGYYDGKLDDIQIYNTYLTATEIGQLGDYENYNNSYNVGKVSYKEGLIVLSNSNWRFGNAYGLPNTSNLLFASTLYDASSSAYVLPGGLSAESTRIRWNSTLTLYQNEFLCRINEEEYNFTLNPSILKQYENTQLPKEFIYDDEFGPYITTIGLYNENAELLAIGKLGGPIKKRSNVDLNIIVRFDQ